MDCPEPIQKETPDLNINKSKKFYSKDENGRIHMIQMEIKENSITFQTEINNEIFNKKYSNNYSFDKLKQNEIFVFQDNLEEIYDQLELYTNGEEISCKVNENRVVITFLTKIKKHPEINFELKPDPINNKSNQIFLLEKLKNLEADNKILKSEIENLKLIVNKYIKEQESEKEKLKNQIFNLNNNLNSINEYIRELKARDKESNKFYDSVIVKEDESQIYAIGLTPIKK